MSFKKITAVFALIAFLLLSSVKGFSNVSYTISFDDDSAQKISVEIPKDWIVTEDGIDTIYDLKLKKKNGDNECWLFFTKTDEPTATEQDLQDSIEEIKNTYFLNKQTENHQFSVQSNLCWHSFELIEENERTNVGICFYFAKNYLFGIMTMNKTDSQSLFDDCNLFIRHIYLLNFGG